MLLWSIIWSIFLVMACSEIVIAGRLENVDKKSQLHKWLFVFMASVMTLIAALRYEWGYDYHEYLHVFENADMIWEAPTQRMEWGFLLLISLFFNGGVDYWTMQFILTVFCCAVIYRHIWLNSKIPIALLFIWACFYFIDTEMEQIRQLLSMSVLVIGWPFIIKRKFILWTLMVMLAMSFHYTAVIAFPLYFTSKIVISDKIAVSLLLVCTFMMLTPPFAPLLLKIIMSFGAYLPARLSNLLMTYAIEPEVMSPNKLVIAFTLAVYAFMIFSYCNDRQGRDKYFLLNFFIAIVFFALSMYHSTRLYRIAKYYLICGCGICAYEAIISEDQFLKLGKWLKYCIMYLFLLASFCIFLRRTNEIVNRPSDYFHDRGIDAVSYHYKTILRK